MSKEDEIICSKCGKKTEDSVILSCNHNLCAPCAADNLIRNELPGINEIQFIICEKCNTKTGIDTKTSKEILSLGLKSINKNNYYKSYQNLNINNNLFNNDNLESDRNRNTATNNLLNLTNNSINNVNPVNSFYFNNKNNLLNDFDINSIKENPNNNNMCKEHGEPLSYLCLDCMSNCVCPECVIHGIHKNHEVLNIKKAFPIIYKNIKDMHNNLNNKIKEINLTKNNIEKRKKDILLLNKKYKVDTRQIFNEIRSLIDKKEKEIMNKIDNHLNDTINELNNYNNIISNKLLSLSKLIQNINSYLIGKNKLELINFYTENKNNIISQLEINEIKNLDLDIKPNFGIELDKNSLNGLISAINNFNVELNSLKAIIPENNNYIGKIKNNQIEKELLKENEIENEIKNEIKNESNILDKNNEIDEKQNNI